MPEISAGDAMPLERLHTWVSQKIETAKSPRSKRFWKKLPGFVFERQLHIPAFICFPVGMALGTLSASSGFWGAVVAVLIAWLLMLLVTIWQAYLAMLWAKLDWWKGWTALGHRGESFYDNPNDWVTKEEYDQEL